MPSSSSPRITAPPEGAINEAIAELDRIGRKDLGTAVKRLWQESDEDGLSEFDRARQSYEAVYAKYDWLGKRPDDPAPGERGYPDCGCAYCRFYRGEGGVRYVMCERAWDALSPEARVEIGESCED